MSAASTLPVRHDTRSLRLERHQLRAIFDYRTTIIAEQFGSAGSPV